MPDELQSPPRTPLGAPATEASSGAATQWDPGNYLLLSLLLPGAGQVAQRRFVAAALQAATVGTYLVTALGVRDGPTIWLALAWNGWSAIDAYLHARVR
jgi:hypothetical protein